MTIEEEALLLRDIIIKLKARCFRVQYKQNAYYGSALEVTHSVGCSIVMHIAADEKVIDYLLQSGLAFLDDAVPIRRR
jgi:hypothetical protein